MGISVPPRRVLPHLQRVERVKNSNARKMASSEVSLGWLIAACLKVLIIGIFWDELIDCAVN